MAVAHDRASIFVRRTTHRRITRALTYGLLTLWALICIFPLYWIALTSLKREPDIITGPYYVPLVDFEPTLEAWKRILADPSDTLFSRYFNSAFVASTATILTLLLSGLAVYGLTRFRVALPVLVPVCAIALLLVVFLIPLIGSTMFVAVAVALIVLWAVRFAKVGPVIGSQAILIAILATRVLPPAVIVLPIYLMALHTGTLDTRSALVFTYTAVNLPVAIWLLLSVLGGSATEQEDAARLDGASHLRIFFDIAVPMARSGIFAVGLLIFILCWNEYLFAAYLTGDRSMTLTPWLVGQVSTKEAQVGEDTIAWPNLSAATILMLAPVVACAVLVQHFLGRIPLGMRRGD